MSGKRRKLRKKKIRVINIPLNKRKIPNTRILNSILVKI